MSKAEKYIEENTKNCSQLHYNNACTLRHCITPDQALEAVKIAREEVIDKVVLHIIHNTRTVHYNNYDIREFNKSSLDDIINDLKQAMKDE